MVVKIQIGGLISMFKKSILKSCLFALCLATPQPAQADFFGAMLVSSIPLMGAFYTGLGCAILSSRAFMGHYTNAKNAVRNQDDIASYTVKIHQSRSSTKEIIFTSSTPTGIIQETTNFFHNNDNSASTWSIYPSITLKKNNKELRLRTITKRSSTKKEVLTQRLTKRFVVSKKHLTTNDEIAITGATTLGMLATVPALFFIFV